MQRVLYDQKWADKQERGFMQWMNHVLCVDRNEKTGSDIKSLYPSSNTGAGAAAATAASVSATGSHAQSLSSFLVIKLNALIRKRAFAVYHSAEIESVIARVEQEVEAGRLVLRADKDIYDGWCLLTRCHMPYVICLQLFMLSVCGVVVMIRCRIARCDE